LTAEALAKAVEEKEAPRASEGLLFCAAKKLGREVYPAEACPIFIQISPSVRSDILA